jgi:leucyl-tRNA synthetase
MSKSKRNVVDPEDLIDRYGADTVRMFCLFASPPERDLEWSDQGVEGSFRFLNRVWRLILEHLDAIKEVSAYSGSEALVGSLRDLERKIHQTIKKVTTDIEDRFHFNTAISAVMELVNDLSKYLAGNDEKDMLAWSVVREAVETTVILLSPVVPHIAEELWQILGQEGNLIDVRWPIHRAEALEVEQKMIVLQVNGKVRSRIHVSASINQKEMEAEALKDERVKQFIGEKKVKKVIVVKDKLVNVVV